MLIKSHSTIHQ